MQLESWYFPWAMLCACLISKISVFCASVTGLFNSLEFVWPVPQAFQTTAQATRQGQKFQTCGEPCTCTFEWAQKILESWVSPCFSRGSYVALEINYPESSYSGQFFHLISSRQTSSETRAMRTCQPTTTSAPNAAPIFGPLSLISALLFVKIARNANTKCVWGGKRWRDQYLTASEYTQPIGGVVVLVTQPCTSISCNMRQKSSIRRTEIGATSRLFMRLSSVLPAQISRLKS